MQKNKKIQLTYLLLFIYIGYFSCVSLFVHSHIYKGVVYIHSHPFQKTSNENQNQLPIEAHHHTANTFFTLNQVSWIPAGSVKAIIALDIILPISRFIFKELTSEKVFESPKFIFNLRAPPLF
jgi:hypothetical protein